MRGLFKYPGRASLSSSEASSPQCPYLEINAVWSEDTDLFSPEISDFKVFSHQVSKNGGSWNFKSASGSISVTVFGWSQKVSWEHSMKYIGVKYKIELDDVKKPAVTIHTGTWMVSTVFYIILFAFVNIYILWNGLEKPFETIQNVILMHKLIHIHPVFHSLKMLCPIAIMYIKHNHF